MNEPRPRRRAKVMAAVALIVFIAVVFQRVHRFGFINYDDDHLLYRNPFVSTGISLRNVIWAFTSTEKLQWAPLTWLSHMVDFQLFGGNPSGHHLVSLAIHLVNTLLLLAFLEKATCAYWRSLFVAALFALHPLHVEPVAWVSARKDLVSTAFFLLTLLAYSTYVRRRSTAAYLLTLAAHVGSLMAKPMYVTLPVVLLLLDYWPLDRVDPVDRSPKRGVASARLLLEKVPFLILGVVFSGVAYLTQSRSGAVTAFSEGDLAVRASTVVATYAHAVWKAIWPATLAILYPAPESFSPWSVIAQAAALALVSALVIASARTRPYLLVGWLWFVVLLLPVSGVVKIGSALMADKFMYMPLVGLLIMAAWWVPDLAGRWKGRWRPAVLVTAALALIAAGAARSSAYLEHWRDSKTLYTEALAVTDRNFLVMGNLGAAYQDDGDLDSAIRYYFESVQAEPRFEIGHANLGHLLLTRNDCDRAVPHFQAALQLRPGYRRAERGLAYCRSRQLEPGRSPAPAGPRVR